MSKFISFLSIFMILMSGFFVWQLSVLYSSFSRISPALTSKNLESDVTKLNSPRLNNEPAFLMIEHRTNSDSVASIEAIVARLKRDVVVTGTILRTPETDSAMFRIKAMADQEFFVNKQLVDGFIITSITRTRVVLTNQKGSGTITLPVRNNFSLQKTPIENSNGIPFENNQLTMLKYYNQDIRPVHDPRFAEKQRQEARPEYQKPMLRYYNQERMTYLEGRTEEIQSKNSGPMLKYYNQAISADDAGRRQIR